MASINPLSMRERARVRGECKASSVPLPPHPAFGHLLPRGEGLNGRLTLIRFGDDNLYSGTGINQMSFLQKPVFLYTVILN